MFYNVIMNRVLARMGDVYLDDTVDDGASPADYEVEWWVAHPEYALSPTVNDIAVIRLKTLVQFTGNHLHYPQVTSKTCILITRNQPIMSDWAAVCVPCTHVKSLLQENYIGVKLV